MSNSRRQVQSVSQLALRAQLSSFDLTATASV